jgi:hypothetical protein
MSRAIGTRHGTPLSDAQPALAQQPTSWVAYQSVQADRYLVAEGRALESAREAVDGLPTASIATPKWEKPVKPTDCTLRCNATSPTWPDWNKKCKQLPKRRLNTKPNWPPAQPAGKPKVTQAPSQGHGEPQGSPTTVVTNRPRPVPGNGRPDPHTERTAPDDRRPGQYTSAKSPRSRPKSRSVPAPSPSSTAACGSTAS